MRINVRDVLRIAHPTYMLVDFSKQTFYVGRPARGGAFSHPFTITRF